MTTAKRKFANDLTARGNNVEIISRGPGKTFDFRVNGISMEFKALQNPNRCCRTPFYDKGL